MRKSHIILLSSLCASSVLAMAAPAHAYVYRYEPGVPAVVTHMSELDPQTKQSPPQATPAPPQNLAPVTLPPKKPEVLSHPFFSTVTLTTAQKLHPSLKRKPSAAPHAAAAKTAQTTKTAEATKKKTATPAAPAPQQAAQTALTQTTPVKSAAAKPAPAEPAAIRLAANAPAPAVPTPADLTLDFANTSSALSPAAKKKLSSIAKQMKDIDNLRLQIRGYAKGDGGIDSARRMSLSRVLVVRSFLMSEGIKPIRLDVQALGSKTSRQPIDRVDLVFVR